MKITDSLYLIGTAIVMLGIGLVVGVYMRNSLIIGSAAIIIGLIFTSISLIIDKKKQNTSNQSLKGRM